MLNKGDMVYIPSNTYLTQGGDKRGVVKFKLLDKPANVVLLSVATPKQLCCEVLHEGEIWLVDESDVFAVRERKEYINDC